MRRFFGCISVCFLLACVFTGSGEADWLNHPRWEDGLAEVALYDGTFDRYGIPRTGSLEIVTVPEQGESAKRAPSETRPSPKGSRRSGVDVPFSPVFC